MTSTRAVIVGAGPAGLAMSRSLADRGVDHVVIERGRVAESWRSERWDSLRLLTPNWQSRLPGWWYRGDDPDGFMTASEVVAYFDEYAASFSAPVAEETEVLAVERNGTGYRVATNNGDWRAAAVVIATGHCQAPRLPDFAKALPPRIRQVAAMHYRNPQELPPGNVLVVGASASGVQLADELQRSGRQVTLAVGRHTRLPRRYRGRDIMWWLDRIGVLAERAEDVPDLEAARRQPSLQLAGRDDGRSLDLAPLADAGVRLVGHLVAVEGCVLRFARDLNRTTAAADTKLFRLIARIEDFIAGHPALDAGARDEIAARSFSSSIERLDLDAEGITAIVWATGYARSYPWLRVPVLDEAGEIRHDGGITPSPGLYAMGLRFMRRRNSSFIDGVGADAAALADHLAARLAAGATLAA